MEEHTLEDYKRNLNELKSELFIWENKRAKYGDNDEELNYIIKDTKDMIAITEKMIKGCKE